MKRFIAAGFVFALLISLTGCWGGTVKNNTPGEEYWADGVLTQEEVRGHYDITFKADGEEAFCYPLDFITLDGRLTMTLRPNSSDSTMLAFDSYDPKTGAAELKQSEAGEDGIYTLFCKITFAEENGKLVFKGNYTIEVDGVVRKDYVISGSMI